MHKLELKKLPGKTIKSPLPDNFCHFVPWACYQFGLAYNTVVTQIHAEFLGSAPSIRSKKRLPTVSTSVQLDSSLDYDVPLFNLDNNDTKTIHVTAIYECNNLVKIKIAKSPILPRELLKVIGLTLPFQKNLASISIDNNVNMETIYEISKLISVSNITELILDRNKLENINFGILLDVPNCLRHLSLANCGINDSVVKDIAVFLEYPKSTSKTLCILNFGSNTITDTGAKYIAQALRSNRQLNYLNLCGNSLTDIGAAQILNSLKQFPITYEERLESRKRHITYLRKKASMILKILHAPADTNSDVKGKKKSTKPHTAPRRSSRLGKEVSLTSQKGLQESLERAKLAALKVLGSYKDPFSKDHTTIINGVTHCLGNNTLCYLNLAYNNLSYLSVKKILDVLKCQSTYYRKPRGLFRIRIEGNPLPDSCEEYWQIEDLIGAILPTRSIVMKKKIPASSPRSF